MDNNQSTYKTGKANQQYNALYHKFEDNLKKQEQEQEQEQAHEQEIQNNNISNNMSDDDILSMRPTQEEKLKTRNETDQIINEKLSAKEKMNNPLDISLIIDKIDKLQISDTDKVFLLNQIRQNMSLPSLGEDESINRIHNKYITEPNTQQLNMMSSYNPQMHYPSSMMPPNMMQPNMMQPNMTHSSMMQPSMMPPNMMQPNMMTPNMMPPNMMTTMHYDILKNKLDAVQLELVDLLRHVKDYTQRYMNSTRQQDMEKIEAYITSLFNIDKQIKEAKEDAKKIDEKILINTEPKTEPETEPEPEDLQQSIISKATNSIKNFFGGIGNNVAGVAKLVSSTANIANGYLSKNIIANNKTTEPKPTAPNPTDLKSTELKPTDQKPLEAKPLPLDTNTNTIKNVQGTQQNNLAPNTTNTSTTTTNTSNKNIITSSNNNFNNANTSNSKQQGRNIVSIDEYIASNAKQINNLTQQPNPYTNTNANANILNVNNNNNQQKHIIPPKNIQNTIPQQQPQNNTIISSNANNINSLLKVNKINNNTQHNEPLDTITQSINELNTHINIENENENENANANTNTINTNTTTTLPQTNIQSGGTRINKLYKNINLLKLKITKQKLQKELHNIHRYAIPTHTKYNTNINTNINKIQKTNKSYSTKTKKK